MRESTKQRAVLAVMGLLLMGAGAALLIPHVGWSGFAGLILMLWGNNASQVKL